jgi:hypothetical protein
MRKASIIALVLAAVAAIGIFAVPSVVKPIHAQQYAECISSIAAPACQSAQYGLVTIASGGATTVVVNTTAVTGKAIILLTQDTSTVMGTTLSVTCNTTNQAAWVSARVVGASFTITSASSFTTNPGCYQFHIINQ